MMGVTAFKFVSEPPGPWAIEIVKPELLSGIYRSTDGVRWTGDKLLGRELGMYESDQRLLGALQGIARNHRVTRLEAVAEAARALQEAFIPSGSVAADVVAMTSARTCLTEALAALDGDRKFRPVSVGYEPTEEVEEP